MNIGCAYTFQQFVISTQMTLEDRTFNYAVSTGQNCVILCDRGVMDGQAYVSNEAWQGVLKSTYLYVNICMYIWINMHIYIQCIYIYVYIAKRTCRMRRGRES
jgi:hypothetical protein